MGYKEKVSWLMGAVQCYLFPHLTECLPQPFTDQEQLLVKICEIVKIENHIFDGADTQWLGRPIKERKATARAFIAKSVYQIPHTRALIKALHSNPNLRTICGFEMKMKIPSESTFCRAFAEFSKAGIGGKVFDALVKEHLTDELVGHISRDATAIVGREKPLKKPKVLKAAKKRGRPSNGEVREAVAEKRLDVQVNQTAEEAIAELPTACDRGTKKNAKGFKETWVGYKLHVDVNDTGLPISAVMTSASLHDSQVAIPMIKLTSEKVTYCYDLMDAAYDAHQIAETSRSLGHVPIIDPNPRGGEVIPMAPAEAERYKERSAAERFNSRIKDGFGARDVMVKGIEKVTLHIMLGVVSLFADQLLKIIEY
jgi:hypothetical protein